MALKMKADCCFSINRSSSRYF